MKKIFCFTICIVILFSFNNKYTVTKSIEVKNDKVIAYVHFITVDINEHPLAEAKIAIIKSSGELIGNFITDKTGTIKVKISVPIDSRYSENEKYGMGARGTVTAIAFKNGYRQTVLFEAGISDASSLHYIYMKPLIPNGRNEPETQLARNHHLENYSLVKKYADMINEHVND